MARAANGLHEIVFGGGDQPLVHVPPRVVASATYMVEDLHEGESSSGRDLVASGAATVDSYSRKTSAAAGRGESDPRLLTVGTVVGVSEGQHLRISSSGGAETRIVEYASGTTIRLTRPLATNHPTEADVEGIEISGTFPAASAADSDLYDGDRVLEVTWYYELLSEPTYVTEQIRMVRSRFEAAYIAPVEQVLRATHSALVKQLDPYGDSLREIIEDAAEQIELKLRRKNYDPTTFLAGRAGFQLVKSKTLEIIAENGIHPPGFSSSEYLEHMAGQMARAMNNLHGRPPLDTADVDRGSNTVTSNRSRRLGGVRRA